MRPVFAIPTYELEPKDAREVILKGRLGKAKEFQTNLFRQENTT